MLSIKENNKYGFGFETSTLGNRPYDSYNSNFLIAQNNEFSIAKNLGIISKSETNNSYNVSKEVSVPDNLLYNLRKLIQISQLKDDWDGCGAKPFKEDFVNEIRNIILDLNVKTNVFPLSKGRIQLAFKDKNSNYMEMDFLYNDKSIKILKVVNGKELSDYIKDYNMSKINNCIKSFYGL